MGKYDCESWRRLSVSLLYTINVLTYCTLQYSSLNRSDCQKDTYLSHRIHWSWKIQNGRQRKFRSRPSVNVTKAEKRHLAFFQTVTNINAQSYILQENIAVLIFSSHLPCIFSHSDHLFQQWMQTHCWRATYC